MKQFKNLILAGALVVGLAGFAVSCNKYGDDIEEIRSELNKLATKDDVASQIASLQSALSAAQSATNDAKAAAEKALADAKAAGDQAAAAKAAADKAAAEAKEAVLAEIEETLAALQEQLESVTEDALAEVAKAVEDAKKELESITSIAGAVTSVELVYSYKSQAGNGMGTDLSFSTVIEQANIFGEGLEGEITFKEGKQTQTKDNLVIRVSPANAVLTKEMISFVNSQGENLDDMVEVVSIDEYEGLLTRAAENSGLWKVTVALKEYDEDTFNEATLVIDEDENEHPILFAVQVNNTKENTDRYVTSSYDVTFAWDAFKPESALDFTVNKKPVSEINNRFKDNSLSLENPATDAEAVALYDELKWKKTSKDYPTPATDIIDDATHNKSNVETDGADDRSKLKVYPAVQEEGLTITITDKKAAANIRAIYVTLDEKENAIESKPSEWNAWKSYKIGNLNTVVEETTITLTFDNAGEAIHDIIGFRVYAVNNDGTLVDPDGKAFYVSLGMEGENWNAVQTIVTPTKQLTGTGDETSAKKDLAIETAVNKTDISEFTWATKDVVRNVKWNGGKDNLYVEADYATKSRIYYGDDEDETEALFHVAFYNAKNEEIFNTSKTYTTYPDFNTVTYIKTFVNTNIIRKDNTAGVTWASFEDGKEYVGTLTLKDKTGHVLATINVSMTKELAKKGPEGFSIKTAQLNEAGVWNAYLIPVESKVGFTPSWAYVANAPKPIGAFDLDNLFNYGKLTEAQLNNITVTFAASQTGQENGKDVKKPVDVKYVDGHILYIDNELKNGESVYIDNTTEHATTVSYDYGYISSVTKKDAAGKATNELVSYVAPIEEFKTVYNDIYNAYDWKWASKLDLGITDTKKDFPSDYFKEIVYGTEEVIINTNYIRGENTYFYEYSVFLAELYKESAEIVEAKLLSSGKEEYYKNGDVSVAGQITFEFDSNSTVPTTDVPLTLEITVADMFGHKHTIELGMTLVKQ